MMKMFKSKPDRKDTKSLKWLFEIFKSRMPLMIFLIFINAFISVFGVIYIFLTRNLINSATAKDTNSFAFSLIWLSVIFAFQLICKAALQSLQVKVQSKFEIALKTRAVNAVMKKDYSSVTAFQSGELITRLTSDVQIVSENIVSFLPGMVSLITRLAIAVAALVYIDVRFCLVFLIGGILLLLVNSVVRPFMKKLHKDVLEKEGKIRTLFLEIISSLLTVKVFGIEEKINAQSLKLQNEHYKAKIKRKNISVLANSAFSFVFQAGYLFALGWSAVTMLIKTTDFGSFTAIIQLVGQIQSPFASLSGIVPRYYAVIASADRLRELEELADEKYSSQKPLSPARLYVELESINVDNISFGYNDNKILENSSISIKKGSFTIISGISGIGKSTLFKLLLGVINPCEGEIFLEKQNREKVTLSQNTRGLFAYVPQGNLLMSGTIRESVSLVNRAVTEEEIQNALDLACAKEFVDNLPLGLDSDIGEHGQGLSEGQVQRLAVARALLSQAPILLLDEATSALDEETEEKLLKNLKEQKDKTLILISHKKAAYNICTDEIRIENKKLTHNPLI